MNFVKNTLGFSSIMPSLRRGENNWTTMASSLSTLHNQGIKVEWSEFHRPFETSLRLLDLPTYAWNEKNYWIMYKKDWCLTKGNDHYDNEVGAQLGIESAKPPQAAGAAAAGATTQAVSSLSTSLVQQIISEEFDVANGTAKVTMQSDLMHPEFRAAAWGHKMNNCGVVTSVSLFLFDSVMTTLTDLPLASPSTATLPTPSANTPTTSSNPRTRPKST